MIRPEVIDLLLTPEFWFVLAAGAGSAIGAVWIPFIRPALKKAATVRESVKCDAVKRLHGPEGKRSERVVEVISLLQDNERQLQYIETWSMQTFYYLLALLLSSSLVGAMLKLKVVDGTSNFWLVALVALVLAVFAGQYGFHAFEVMRWNLKTHPRRESPD
jgi:membrane protein YdbS with pleckstrin-like domain